MCRLKEKQIKIKNDKCKSKEINLQKSKEGDRTKTEPRTALLEKVKREKEN